MFHHLKLFSLRNCSLTSLTINTNIKNIVLSNLGLRTISGIGNVKSLDISDCQLLTHIGDLIKAESVKVTSLRSLNDFSFNFQGSYCYMS
jgi:hypothetical protein